LIARKALRVNLSDLAAKGATPVGYLLALSLPKDWREEWIAAFARGLAHDQDAFSLCLLGGDTTTTPGPLTIAITALGSAAERCIVRRKGAQIGDAVFVTGTIGDAAGGLAVLKGEDGALTLAERDALIARYRVPEPRLAFGARLPGLANASLDVSDGLLADLGHVAEVSGVRIVVEAAKIPVSPALGRLWGSEAGLRGATAGDDYEIALTAAPSHRPQIVEAAQQTGTRLTEIGRVEAGQGVALVDAKGLEIPVKRPGYVHF
jgi:thiamine-monophosphate kinase